MATLPDYTVNVAQPFAEAVKGYQIGMNMELQQQNLAAQRQQMEEQRIAQQLAQQQAQERQNAINQRVQSIMDNPNPTAKDYTNLATLLPPEQAKSVRENWDTLRKDQQDNELRFSGQVMSAFNAGSPQIGIDMLRQRAAAARNSGQEDQAKGYDTWADIAQADPKMAQVAIGAMVSGLPGGDKVLTSAIAAAKAPGEIRKGEAEAFKTAAEAANTPERLALAGQYTRKQMQDIDSQIQNRAEKIALDRAEFGFNKDKFQSEVELKLFELGQKGTKLEPSATKIVNDSTIAAVGAEQTASQMLNLAGRLEREGGGFGAATSASEWFKRATGNQDGWTQARQEYVRMRNSQAIKMLPPGPATDKDIELAMKGFPPDNADAKTISAFMRGMAKMQQYEAVAESAKAEWVNSVGSLGRATSDIQIGNTQVPKGTSYVDFARQFMDKRASDLAASQGTQAVQGRGYMKYANPAGQ